MATFGEVFELCKVPNGAGLIGVEKHSEEDHFILTFKNKDVLVYNIVDRKIVHSWSVEPNENLTCPVVHHDGSYYGLKDEIWLLLWEDAVPELWQSSMLKLPRPAQSVHVCTSRRFQHEPVLIFKDNEAIPFKQVGNERKKKSAKTKERLLWCGMHMAADSNVWFSKVLTSEDCTKVSLVMHLFKESKQQVFSITAPDKSKILCWTLVDEENESAFFISLWSNGGVYKTEVPAVNEAKSKPNLCCEHMFNVCEGSLPNAEASPMHLSHVALSFVCVAGSDTTNGTQNDTLSLWDTKFKTLHCQKPLADCLKSASAASSSPSVRHLQSTSSFIIVASDSCVSVCPYTAEKSTLKSSLGILQQSDKKSRKLKPQFLTTPKLIEPGQSVDEWERNVSKDDEAENEMLCRLLDVRKTKTAKKLASELRKYFETFTLAESHSEKPTVSQYFVTSIFERCTREKDLWSSETGRLILQTCVLPQRCFSQFLSLVWENNDIAFLQECFFSLNGISESTLVDCLKFVLRCKDDSFPTCEGTEFWEETNSPCSLSRAKYLSLVISHPINDVFLQTSLKKLHFEEVLVFLKFLLYLIKCWSITLRDLLRMEKSTHILSFSQILDWAALTLNAHFTQLILMPETQTLLVNMHKVIAQQIATDEHYQQLNGYLTHFKKHEPLPENDYSSAYVIESIEF